LGSFHKQPSNHTAKLRTDDLLLMIWAGEFVLIKSHRIIACLGRAGSVKSARATAPQPPNGFGSRENPAVQIPGALRSWLPSDFGDARAIPVASIAGCAGAECSSSKLPKTQTLKHHQETERALPFSTPWPNKAQLNLLLP